MRLEAIRLERFRGYIDSDWIAISDLTTFVGRNDAGKSTILEGLDIFFGGDSVKPDRSDLNVHTAENSFAISCRFADIPEQLTLDSQAPTALKDEYLLNDSGQLELVKVFTATSAKPKEEVFANCIHPSNEKLNNLLELSNTQLKTLARELLEEQTFNAVKKSSNPKIRRALWRSTEIHTESRLVPLTKEDAKKIWGNISAHLPAFALFQSDRKSTDADSEVQEPMKLAIAAALADENIASLLEQVTTAVRGHAVLLAKRTHEALQEIDSSLAEDLVPEFKNDPKWASLFSVSLQGDTGIPINKRGSGVRRLVLVSFFKAEASRRGEESGKSNVIYALEEPETSQHPHNQKVLLDSFKSMSERGGTQIILTSHSPGFVGDLPAESLRHVRKDSATKVPQVQMGDESTWEEIAEELGVQPDNRVRVLICVEGKHDVSALQNFSRLLHGHDPIAYPDLSSDPRFAFVPLGGSSLTQWVSKHYLRGFGRPEFHLYDNDNPEYKVAADEVNRRNDGSQGIITGKLMMENYIHPEAIFAALQVRVEISDDSDVPQLVSDARRSDPNLTPLSKKNVKEHLNNRATSLMTMGQLDESDPDEHVKSWMRQLTEMIDS